MWTELTSKRNTYVLFYASADFRKNRAVKNKSNAGVILCTKKDKSRQNLNPTWEKCIEKRTARTENTAAARTELETDSPYKVNTTCAWKLVVAFLEFGMLGYVCCKCNLFDFIFIFFF